jgi:hypothetical protein
VPFAVLNPARRKRRPYKSEADYGQKLRCAPWPDILFQVLDSAARNRKAPPLLFSPMGQQLNKHIKRKRRAAYLKRKKVLAKTAAKKK